MQLNLTSASFVFAKPLRSMGVCSQYLRYKVAMRIAIRHAKRQAFNCLRLLAGWTLPSWALTSCAMAGLLFYANTSHTAEKGMQ